MPRLNKHIPTAMNTNNNRRIAGWVYLCIPLSLLGTNSVKMFLQQQRIAGITVFYVVHVVSKECR
jgi:hypothetical protein